MVVRNFLIIVLCAVLVCCNGRSESQVAGKRNLLDQQGGGVTKEDSIVLQKISNRISELIMSNSGSILSDNSLQQEIEILLDSALSIDENDFLTNYNYFLYAGVMSDYEERFIILPNL